MSTIPTPPKTEISFYKRVVTPLNIIFLCVIVNVYLLATISWHISTMEGELFQMNKLNLAFQAQVLDQFKTVHTEVTNELEKMTITVNALDDSANRRLNTFVQQIDAIRKETEEMQQQVKTMQAEVEGSRRSTDAAASAARAASANASAARAKLNQKVLTGSEVQQAQQSIQAQKQQVAAQKQAAQQKIQAQKQQLQQQKQQFRQEKKGKAPPGFHPFGL